MKIVNHWLFMLLSLLVLSGCGGASGDNEVTTTPTIGAKLTFSVTDTQGNSISSAQASSTSLLKVRATNEFGSSESGVTITFATDLGTLSATTALTGSDGVAQVTLTTTSTDLGVASFTADGTVDGTALTTSGQLEITEFIASAGPVLTLSTLDASCSGQLTTQASGSTLCLRATLTQDNVPLTNQIIEFSASVGALVQNTALTDANGSANVFLTSAADTSGAATAVATYGTVSAQQNYQFSQTTGTNAPTLSLVMLDSNCTTVVNSLPASSSYCLQASLFANNQPQTGEIVTFNAGLGTLRTTTALTNAAGVASVMLDSSSTILGASIATATFDTISSSQNYQYSEASGGSTLTLSLQVLDSNCALSANQAQAGETLCLQAALMQGSTPRSSEVITFDTPVGTASPSTALTNSSGIARVLINSTSSDIGAATATASFDQLAAGATYEFTRGSGQDQTVISMKVFAQDCTSEITEAAAGESLCLEATLTQGSTPIINEIVNFSASLGTLSPASALTDSTGVANVLLLSTTEDLGAGTVTADYQGLNVSRNYQLVATQGSLDLTMALYEEDCTTSKDSFPAGAAVCVKALLVDGEMPVENQIVNFEFPLGTLRQTSALTDVDGFARVTADSTDAQLGAATAAATHANLRSTQNYEFVSDGSLPNTTPSIELATFLASVPANRFQAEIAVKLRATIKDADGNALPDTIVAFTAERGALTTNSALTDANGEAEVDLTGAVDNIGAAVATAQINVSGSTYTQTHNYEILSSDAVTLESAQIGYFIDADTFVKGEIGTSITKESDGTVNLSAGGTMGLTVVVVDDAGVRIATPTPVTYTSACAANGQVNLDSQVTTVNGEARATYEDVRCATVSGNQDILVASITVNNVSLSANLTVNLQPESVGSIEFISADPTNIVLQGTGGQGKRETSTLTFQVNGVLGNPLTQQLVNFNLDSGVGDLQISPTSSLTNSQGLVTTRVTSGNVPAAIRVTASTVVGQDDQGNDQVISTQSDLLSINTGLPDQNSITLSTTDFNPETHNISGTDITLIAYMADSFNNPVPDGTTINFTTEGGFITPTCNTVNGRCETVWTSGNPRVPNHRITITATAIGHETFFDTNGNNVFDDNDGVALDQGTDSGIGRGNYESSGFVDHSEAWRDDNENRVWDVGEIFIDYDNDNVFDAADGKFNGPQCTHATLCGVEPHAKINVRKSLIMIMSSNNPQYTLMTSDLTPGTNAALAHIGDNHVLITNDTESNVAADGLVQVTTQGTSAATDGRITVGEGLSLPLQLAFADDAEGLGQILPSGTTVSVTTSAGSIAGTSSFTVPSTNKYVSSDGSDRFGGDIMSFSLINTNSTTTGGESNQEGVLLIEFTFRDSNIVVPVSVDIFMLGN